MGSKLTTEQRKSESEPPSSSLTPEKKKSDPGQQSSFTTKQKKTLLYGNLRRNLSNETKRSKRRRPVTTEQNRSDSQQPKSDLTTQLKRSDSGKLRRSLNRKQRRSFSQKPRILTTEQMRSDSQQPKSDLITQLKGSDYENLRSLNSKQRTSFSQKPRIQKSHGSGQLSNFATQQKRDDSVQQKYNLAIDECTSSLSNNLTIEQKRSNTEQQSNNVATKQKRDVSVQQRYSLVIDEWRSSLSNNLTAEQKRSEFGQQSNLTIQQKSSNSEQGNDLATEQKSSNSGQQGNNLATQQKRDVSVQQRYSLVIDEWRSSLSNNLTTEQERSDTEQQSNNLAAQQESSNSGQQGNDLTTEQEKCYNSKDSTLCFVDGADDMDFLYNDYKSLRAKMSCGHTVTPMSLTNWCRRLLDEGECRFVCGQTGCDVEWPYEEVCKMALLTPEEMKYFENKLFSNASKDYLDVKLCPGCKCSVVRTDLDKLQVCCILCTADRNKAFTFCWQCLNEWKHPSPYSDRCANKGCISKSQEILNTCPDITFKDVRGVTGCPSIRACPTCGLLVEHNKSQCKNIRCPRCKVKFCFVCLKRSEDCQKLDNYSFYTLCSGGVAPRQTSIPVWQRK